MLIKILEIALQYKEAGVALFFAILFYFDMRKEVKKMKEIVETDSDNTVKVNETMSKLEKTIENHLAHSIDNLTTEVRKLNDK